MAKKKCICDEISAKMGFESRTFDCPQHGAMTIDRRIPNAQITTWPPSNPYIYYTSGQFQLGQNTQGGFNGN